MRDRISLRETGNDWRQKNTKWRKKVSSETKFLSTQFNAILNRVTFHCFMFDSLTKYVQHFRWISICFMIAKNVCIRYICIFLFACCLYLFIYFRSFQLAVFCSSKKLFFPQWFDITICLNSRKFKSNIYKYFDQIKKTWKQVISKTDSYALFT